MAKASMVNGTWAEIRTLNSEMLMERKIKGGKMGTVRFKMSVSSNFEFHIISDEQYQSYRDMNSENKRLKTQLEIIKNTVDL